MNQYKQVDCLLLLCFISTLLASVMAEKGDTFIAKMTSTGLPPGSSFVAPTGKMANTSVVNGLMTDSGIKKFYQTYTYSIDFPSDTFVWSRVGLANTKLPGSGIFLNVTYYTEPTFFVYGNWSANQIENSLKANGLDVSSLADNSTYMVTVINETTQEAVGGVLIARTVAAFGNGSTGDTTGTDSDLISEEVYVISIDNSTVSFDKGVGGFQSGYKSGQGNGVGILQHVNDTYTWTLETSNITNPKSMQLRYYVDLAYQPIVAEFNPDPPFPKRKNGTIEEGTVFNGNITQAEIDIGLQRLGIDWKTTNFNNTPNVYMVTLNDHNNGTILGFIYNSDEQPPPQPIIKGEPTNAAGRASSIVGTLLSFTVAMYFFNL